MANFIVFLCILIIVVIWVIIFMFVAPMAIPQMAKGLRWKKGKSSNT